MQKKVFLQCKKNLNLNCINAEKFTESDDPGGADHGADRRESGHHSKKTTSGVAEKEGETADGVVDIN